MNFLHQKHSKGSCQKRLEKKAISTLWSDRKLANFACSNSEGRNVPNELWIPVRRVSLGERDKLREEPFSLQADIRGHMQSLRMGLIDK